MFFIKISTLALLFNICTAISIYYSGKRDIFKHIIKKDFFSVEIIYPIIAAVILALFARFFFISINFFINENPEYKISSTTLTAAITASSYIFILIANSILLDEKISLNIVTGFALIILGIFICFYK